MVREIVKPRNICNKDFFSVDAFIILISANIQALYRGIYFTAKKPQEYRSTKRMFNELIVIYNTEI